MVAACLGMSLGSTATAGEITSKVDVSIWGRAKFDMHYDNADLRGDTDFATNISSDPENYDAELNFNPRDTRFGLKGQAVEGDLTCGAVMETDFYGTNAANNLIPRMRLGYAFLEKGGFSLRAGQDWIPIAQQNPATIDFGILSYAGNLWWRVPQVTARYKMKGGIELLGSVMKHRINGAVDHEEVMPWMIGRVAYSNFINGKGLLAVGAGFRSVEVDSIDYSPFLVAGEFVLPFSAKLTLQGEVYTGAGVGEEFLHYGFEYNPNHPDDAAGKGRTIATTGGFANLTFQAAPKVALNVGAGMDDPDETDAEGMASIPYTKNTVIFGNVQMKLTSFAGIGFEVMHIMTEQGEDANGDAVEWKGQRFTGSMWYSF
jgi:hypothetical protein